MSFTVNGRLYRKSTGTGNKKLAEKIYAKVRTQVTEGRWFDQPQGEDRTLGELLDRYIEEHSRPNKSKSSLTGDKGMAREMKEFLGENTRLKDITPRQLSKYKSWCRDKDLSPSSINHRRQLLHHAFKFAIREWEWTSHNPVDRISREKVDNARDRWLTLEEERRLLDNCVIYVTGPKNVQEPRYWLRELVTFALNTGMRQDEILSLRWPEVDLFRRTATVIKSKNGEKRTIPLNKRALELLKGKTKVRDIRCNLVFPNEVGRKMDNRNVLRGFYNALDRAEIEDFRFHDLRHTFATRLAQAGVDIYKIARILGHKDIKMTQRYAHHYPESLRDAVEVLDASDTATDTLTDTPKQKGVTPVA